MSLPLTVLRVGLLALPMVAASAQSRTPGGMPPPAGMGLAQSASMRFPQPVRVGDLIDRVVLEPAESQAVLGRVRQVVRDPSGAVFVILDIGGFLGFGRRPVVVPVEAMALVGDAMEVVAYTPAQVSGLPTYAPTGADTPLPADASIRVGLAKPSH